MGYAAENGIKALIFDIDGTFYPKRAMMFRLGLASALHLPFALKYNRMRQDLRKETGFEMGDASSLGELQEKESRMMYPGRGVEYFISKEERVFRKPWERLFSNIKPYPDVRNVLMKARSEGYILAALSDFPLPDSGADFKGFIMIRAFLLQQLIGKRLLILALYHFLQDSLAIVKELFMFNII